MITTENVWHFIAFGFLPLPGLLSRDEALAIREEIERLGHERGQVPGDTATERGGIGGVAAVGERVRALMLDERVYDIPAKILGHDFTYEGSDAQWHVGDTPWHGASGVEQKPLATIKVSFYLDDLDETNGCLRIIPGAHRNLLRWMDSRWAGVPDYIFPVRNRTRAGRAPVGDQPTGGAAPAAAVAAGRLVRVHRGHPARILRLERRAPAALVRVHGQSGRRPPEAVGEVPQRHGWRDHGAARVRGVRRPAVAQDGRAVAGDRVGTELSPGACGAVLVRPAPPLPALLVSYK